MSIETNEAVELVRTNFTNDEIYDTFELDDYATVVCSSKHPEDVFDESTLEKWATDNGFTRS